MSYDIAGPTGSWFRHRARDGILETFYNYEHNQEDLMGFIRMAIERAKRDHATDGSQDGRFRLLDSFFTTMLPGQMHDMMKGVLRCKRPIQVLLANPRSEFALARSQSLERQAYPMQEIRRGLHNIHSVLAGRYPEDAAEDLPDIGALVSEIERYSSTSLLSLRFYDKVPSGPMFFFGSILVYGRFCAGHNSNNLPWTMIVTDPSCKGDFYSIYSEEFDHIWGPAESRPSELDSKDAWLIENCSEKVDPITPLLNRSAFDDHLERALRNVSEDRPLSLVYFDIDKFKKVNDRHGGHDSGDKVLSVVGEAMQRVIDRRGRSYRCGGDEFVALLPAFDEKECASTGERIRRTVAGLTFEGIPGLSVTVSVGVACVTSAPDGGPAAFVKRADKAMYAAKSGGGDRVCRASDLNA